MDVTVYGPLREATGEENVAVDFEGGTVAEAVGRFVEAYPTTREYLLTDEGDLRRGVLVRVADEPADPDAEFESDAGMDLYPPNTDEVA